MVTTFLPVVSNNLPPIIGSFHFWAPLFILTVIVFHYRLFLYKQVFLLILFAIVFFYPKLFWPAINDWNSTAIRFEFYYLIVSTIILWYFLSSKDYKGLVSISVITFTFIIITSILSIYSSIIDPLYARSITGGRLDEDTLATFQRIGGGGYGFATSIITLFPVLMYHLKRNQKEVIKFLLFALIILLFYTLIRLQFFANIIIGSFVIIISFSGLKNLRKSLLLSFLLVLFVLIIPLEVYASFFKHISSYFDPSSETYLKLDDMASFFISDGVYEDETGTGYRLYRYFTLFEGFIQAPLLGIASNRYIYYDESGAHLFWINKLSVFGLVAFIVYLKLIIKNINISIKHLISDSMKFFYFLSVVGLLSIGIIKNIAGREPWIIAFVIIPGLLNLKFIKSKFI